MADYKPAPMAALMPSPPLNSMAHCSRWCQSFAESLPVDSEHSTGDDRVAASSPRMPAPVELTLILGVLADSSEPIGLTLRGKSDAIKDLPPSSTRAMRRSSG